MLRRSAVSMPMGKGGSLQSLELLHRSMILLPVLLRNHMWLGVLLDGRLVGLLVLRGEGVLEILGVGVRVALNLVLDLVHMPHGVS